MKLNIQDKRTKIITTIGPASDSEEIIKQLILSGVNVFRFNTSHADIDYHISKIRLVKRVADELGIFVATLVDLQGPKIRVGALKENIKLEKDDELTLKYTAGAPDPCIIPIDYEGFANDVVQGDIIMASDGKIKFEVTDVADKSVFVKVLVPNLLKSGAGINIPGPTSSLNSVTKKDIEYIKFAVNEDADFIALSFVRTKEDILLAKKYINSYDGNIPVIAKLEKPQAIENLDEIVKISDGIMVARGDLGIELSPVEVPILQKQIIKTCLENNKLVIVATQMLESMVENEIPTRAEASDVANAVLDGADAVMLSAETSIGANPVGTVDMMAKIIIKAEQSDLYQYNREGALPEDEVMKTRQAIVYGAEKVIKCVNAKAVLSFSHLGSSTKIMSSVRPEVPIIMICDQKQSARRMTLNWGVYPYYKNWDVPITNDILLKFDEFLINRVGLKRDDFVIITGSQPDLITGKTNFIRIHKVGA